MSSDERLEHILIEDDWCVELDYGQMSLLLLYAEAQAQDHVPVGDLYDLSEYGIPTECRKGIKKVMQAIINSPGVPRRLPKGGPQALPLKDQPHRYSWSCREKAPRDLPTDDLRGWYAAVP